MKKQTLKLIVLLNLIFLILGSNYVSASNIYVDTTKGSDEPGPDRGSETLPFATIEKARDTIRTLRKDQPINVVLRGGTYYLNETFELSAEDSGSETCPITYQACLGEKVVISGGRRLSGTWHRDSGSDIYYMDLSGEGLDFNNLNSLFVNGKRAIRARSPNTDESPNINDDPLKYYNEVTKTFENYIYHYIAGVDGTITKEGLSAWAVTDNDPPGASISLVEDGDGDTDEGVIELRGSGIDNGYDLKNPDRTEWHETLRKTIQWKMKFSEPYRIFVYCKTTTGEGAAGERLIYYTNENVSRKGAGTYIHYGLGASTSQGKWVTTTRDLASDLNAAQPGVSITSIRSFIVRGSGRITGVKLIPPEDEDEYISFKYNGSDISPEWENLKDVEVVSFRQWEQSRFKIEKVSGGKVYFNGRQKEEPCRPYGFDGLEHDRYYVENVFEGLDSPGEWYFNKVNKKILYYYPREGEDIDSSEFIVPRLKQLINVQGPQEASYAVKNIIFQGLTFLHTDWQLPEGGYAGKQAAAYITDPPAINFRYTKDCQFLDNTVAHVGAYAIGSLSENFIICRNHIFDTGAGGIKIGNNDNNYFTGYNTVENNLIHDTNAVYKEGVGIFVMFASNNTISNNMVYDGAYTGISVGWGHDTKSKCYENKIKFNDVHNVMRELSDGAAIYTLGKQIGTEIINNACFDILHRVKIYDDRRRDNGSPILKRMEGYGIYLDEFSRRITAKNNLVYNTFSGIVTKPNNTIENNIFIAPDYWGIIHSYENATSVQGIFNRNIVYFVDQTLDRLIHYRPSDGQKILVPEFAEHNYNLYCPATSASLPPATEWSYDSRSYDSNSILQDQDPGLFVDYANKNFRLQLGSPALLDPPGGIGFKVKGVGADSDDGLDFDNFGPNVARPKAPVVVDDGRVTPVKNKLHASWSVGDAPAAGISEIVEYEYIITQDSITLPDDAEWTSTESPNITIGRDLKKGKSYYFSVKAKNAAGKWSDIGYSDGIIADSIPVAGTVNPSPGSSISGQTVTFITTYTDLDDWGDLKYAYFLINTGTTDTDSSCFKAYYNQNTNKIYLRNDAGTAWLGGFTLGTGTVSLQNSYCILEMTNSAILGLGNTLTINWKVTFKNTFSGAKNIYLYVTDDSDAKSGWVRRGSWTIKDSTPSVGIINPFPGSSVPNQAITFNASYADPSGWQDIKEIYILINNAVDGSNTAVDGRNCLYAKYDQNNNTIFSAIDDGTWQGRFTLGSQKVILQNSYSILECTKSFVQGGIPDLNTLTMTWKVTFKSTFLGKKNIYLRVIDDTGADSGWKYSGTLEII